MPRELGPWHLWDKMRAAAARGELPVFVMVVDDEISYGCRYTVASSSPLRSPDHRTRAKTTVGVMVHTRQKARGDLGLE